ncbi:MAG: hypothetical protein GY847_25720 [Proteobacteria bacterium]|nr:hypothetical protein [Pseudomonadota bacterium]
MKKIIAVIVVALVGAGVGFYFYYSNHLRFTDAFTDCPVAAFRAQATSDDAAYGFVTETSLVSLSNTERCSLDCRHGNIMACVIYGLAMQKGIFVLKSDKESVKILDKACNKGEPLACKLADRAERMAEEKKKAEAEAAAKEANKKKLLKIAKAKGEALRLRHKALDHFGGRKGPMVSGSMLRWYNDTCKYLLYNKPLLSQMHQIPGVRVKKGLSLKELIDAKYLSGEEGPNLELLGEFLAKFKRLGVMQIRLDYRVEKKKESEIKKTHGYFRAKHTFLYNAAGAELEIFGRIEKPLK